jgi:hypothetical protein
MWDRLGVVRGLTDDIEPATCCDRLHRNVFVVIYTAAVAPLQHALLHRGPVSSEGGLRRCPVTNPVALYGGPKSLKVDNRCN